MKITQTHLYARVVPRAVLAALGLRRSRYGSYRLTQDQRTALLRLLGLEAQPEPAPVDPDPELPPLYQHQRDAIARLHELGGRALIAHEPGLGKTRTVIEYLRSLS